MTTRVAVRFPLLQPRGELRALRFHEHEVADGELAHIGIVKRAGVIFRAARHRDEPSPIRISRAVVLLRLDRDAQVILRDVVAHERALFFGGAEQDID